MSADDPNSAIGTTAMTSPRVVTLGYVRAGVMPPKPARLSVLGAIGMLVAAAWFLIHVFVMVFFAAVWWLEPPRIRPVPPAPIPTVSLDAYDGDPIGIDGLREPSRYAVVSHVCRMLKLTGDRSEMLERLLADVGARIFPRDSQFDPFNANLILDAGQMNHGPDGDGPRGSHYFTTSRGRVEISDFTASFVSADAPADRVQITFNVLVDRDEGPRWSALAVMECLDGLYQSSNGLMTSLQAAALLRELREEVPVRNAGWYDHPQVLKPVWWQGGTLSFDRPIPRRLEAFHPPPEPPKPMWLLPDGRMAHRSAAPFGVDPVTSVPYVQIKAMGYRYVPGSRASMVMMSLAALPQIFLWAYLFVGALLLLRDPLAGARRHVRAGMLAVPLLLISMIALIWWLHSLREYGHLPNPADAWILAALAATALAGYPLVAGGVLSGRRVRHFFAAYTLDPWHEIADAWRACVAGSQSEAARRLMRWIAAAMVLLGAMHLIVAAWYLFRPGANEWTSTHLIGAGLCCGVAAVLFTGRLVPGRTRRANVARPMTATLSIVLCVMACFATAQSTAPRPDLTAGQIRDLLTRARNADRAQAEDAIRQLAQAHHAGEGALLELLDGPEPPVGIAVVLSAIGHVWFDTDARWSNQNWRRALRLTPEWIEYIRESDDIRTMAALEALGPAAELEPLLRPLLISPQAVVRNRSSAFLLQINPNPAGIVRLLGRDLEQARTSRERESIVRGLGNLRPASDALLARLLGGTDLVEFQMAADTLLDAGEPLSDELRFIALQYAMEGDPRVNGPALRLLCLDPAGRRELIDLALGDGLSAVPARETLVRLWPHCQPLLPHPSGKLPRERKGTSSATRQILLTINEAGERALADYTLHEDEELEFQSKLVLAAEEYAARLGPQSYRKAVRTTLATVPASSAGLRADWKSTIDALPLAARPPPPRWVTPMLVCLTIFMPLIIVPATFWLCGRHAIGSHNPS